MPTTKSESKPDTCAVHNCHEPVARVVKHGAKPTPADVRDLCRAHRTERLSVRWRKGKASPSAATPKPTAGKQPKPAAKGKPKQPKPAKQWADVADPFATVFAELKTAFEARALVDMIGWDVVRGLAARVSGGGR